MLIFPRKSARLLLAFSLAKEARDAERADANDFGVEDLEDRLELVTGAAVQARIRLARVERAALLQARGRVEEDGPQVGQALDAVEYLALHGELVRVERKLVLTELTVEVDHAHACEAVLRGYADARVEARIGRAGGPAVRLIRVLAVLAVVGRAARAGVRSARVECTISAVQARVRAAAGRRGGRGHD